MSHKFEPLRKEWKSAYQGRKILAFFFKGLRVTKIVTEIKFEGAWDKFWSKKLFYPYLELQLLNSHTTAGIYFIFLESTLSKYWKAFNTKFGLSWKDWKCSYQVMEVLAISRKWLADSSLKLCYRSSIY